MVNNPYTIDLDQALQKGMIRCIRKRDIVTARTLSQEEKKRLQRGAPDVVITTPSGQRLMKSRQEIINEYTYLDGKKISLAGWSSSKQYTIARLDNCEALAMMVPTNCTVSVGKKQANTANRKNGDYIVALVDGDGNIIEDSVGIVPSALFKKMYHIPQQDIIEKHIGGGNKYFNPSGEAVTNVPGYRDKKAVLKRNVDTAGGSFSQPIRVNTEHSGFDFGEQDMYNTPSRNVETTGVNKSRNNNRLVKQPEQPAQAKTQQGNTQPTKQDTGYKYVVVGRLVDSVGETVGFIIQNKQGQTRDITKGQLMGLCKQKVVSNVMLGIREDTGTPYLRGNNMRLDSLPTYEAQFRGQQF